MPNPFDFENEEIQTNEKFAKELARLTTLTTVDIKRLFPRHIDKEAFRQLMAIVNSSANRNRRVAAITQNINQFGMTIVKLLETLK